MKQFVKAYDSILAKFDELGVDAEWVPWFKAGGPRIGDIGLFQFGCRGFDKIATDMSVLNYYDKNKIVVDEPLSKYIEPRNCLNNPNRTFNLKYGEDIVKTEVNNGFQFEWIKNHPKYIRFDKGNTNYFLDNINMSEEVYVICTGVTIAKEYEFNGEPYDGHILYVRFIRIVHDNECERNLLVNYSTQQNIFNKYYFYNRNDTDFYMAEKILTMWLNTVFIKETRELKKKQRRLTLKVRLKAAPCSDAEILLNALHKATFPSQFLLFSLQT